MSIIVHCPSCGAALAVTPRVYEAAPQRGTGLIRFAWQQSQVAHKCPEGER